MIARIRPVRRKPAWHRSFLAMLPSIVTHARIAFRSSNDREDLIQEVVANSFVAFARLAELGKLDLAYPTVLARYAVAQVNDGRRVGTSLNVHDISSSYCQKRKGIVVGRLDHHDRLANEWKEVLLEDRHVGPAETARVRIDFSDWLGTLKRRNRKVAEFLAAGNRTGEAARRFKVCEGRISQIRKELKKAWEAFQGEPLEPLPA